MDEHLRQEWRKLEAERLEEKRKKEERRQKKKTGRQDSRTRTAGKEVENCKYAREKTESKRDKHHKQAKHEPDCQKDS